MLNVKKQIEKYLEQYPEHPDKIEIDHLDRTKEFLPIKEAIKKYGENNFIACSATTYMDKEGFTNSISFMIIEK